MRVLGNKQLFIFTIFVLLSACRKEDEELKPEAILIGENFTYPVNTVFFEDIPPAESGLNSHQEKVFLLTSGIVGLNSDGSFHCYCVYQFWLNFYIPIEMSSTDFSGQFHLLTDDLLISEGLENDTFYVTFQIYRSNDQLDWTKYDLFSEGLMGTVEINQFLKKNVFLHKFNFDLVINNFEGIDNVPVSGSITSYLRNMVGLIDFRNSLIVIKN